MRFLSGPILASALLTLLAAPADAQIGFDDLAGDATAIPAGYGGLQWTSFFHLDGSTDPYPNTGYDIGSVSGTNVALNAFADPAEISAATPFTLGSAYFTAAWNEGLTLEVTGFLAGSQLFFQSFTLSTTSPLHAVFGWAGIDQVRFVSYGGTDLDPLFGDGAMFVMDDLVVTTAPGTTVTPEPVSMALLGTGLAGVGALRRRRRQEAGRA